MYLVSGLTAILLVVAGLIAGIQVARGIEYRYVDALAPQQLDLNITGSVLQKAALRQPDLLLVYGSSELAFDVPGYTASEVFRTYPTGFMPFVVAKGGVTSLIMAQEAAAVGNSLRGKKVVISFTPTVFFKEAVKLSTYTGLFSPLHANELAFSTQLSFTTKQAAARRMLAYPSTLTKDPILHFALARLAGGSWPDRMLYDLIWPLGKLQTTLLELQDHWQTLAAIWGQSQLKPNVPHQPATIDWQALIVKARQEQKKRANNNAYGIDNALWTKRYHTLMVREANTLTDSLATQELRQSVEWTDLAILLRILRDLGARPLILSSPFHEAYWNVVGLSESGRQVYYDKLVQVARRYQTPVIDFEKNDDDKYFSRDGSSHPSRVGWLYLDKTLDEFYHGTLR